MLVGEEGGLLKAESASPSSSESDEEQSESHSLPMCASPLPSCSFSSSLSSLYFIVPGHYHYRDIVL
jgi:hypothetical protein